MLDLDQIVAQREEATGVADGRVPFGFTAKDGPKKGERLEFSFMDPVALPDDVADELEEVADSNTEVGLLLMGEEEYERFLDAGGSGALFGQVVNAYRESVTGYMEDGNPTRGNRSSRHMAARKRRKQH